MVSAAYQVSGMTCGHCASAVTSELKELDGVNTVDVNVATGAVTVDSSKALELNDVRTAIDEAGYTLVTGN